MRIETLSGPVTLAYRVTEDGWAIADDIVLGRADTLGFRDAAVIGRWHRGTIRYVWDISDDEDNCALDLQRYCRDEVAAYTDSTLDADGVPLGVWAEFRETVRLETPLTLIDVTSCWESPTCKPDIEGQDLMFIRRARAFDTDNIPCDPANNTARASVTFEVKTPEAGIWTLTVDAVADAFEAHEVEFNADMMDAPEDIAQALHAALVEHNEGLDIDGIAKPLASSSVDGASITLTALEPIELEFELKPPMDGEVTTKSVASACVGGAQCKNDDCEGSRICTNIWNPDTDAHDGETYCRSSPGHASLGAQPEATLGIPVNWLIRRKLAGLAHELRHIAGYAHEQSRADADTALTLANPNCVLDGAIHNFEPPDDLEISGLAGPVDFASNLMYSSRSRCESSAICSNQCLNALEGACPPSVCGEVNEIHAEGHPNADPLYYIKTPSWFEGWETYGKAEDVPCAEGVQGCQKIPRGRLGLSYMDQDAMRMYGGDAFWQANVQGWSPWIPADENPAKAWDYQAESGDRLGASIALGQFGHENRAAIVGSPGETVAGPIDVDLHLEHTGAVMVWEATRFTEPAVGALADWEKDNLHAPGLPAYARHAWYSQAAFDPSAPNYGVAAEDQFGSAVVAVDLDGDGLDEIAVGTPYEGVDDIGRVFIYRADSSKAKHEPWQVVEAPVESDAGSHFGWAVTAVDTNNDGREELAVGAPDWRNNMTGAGDGLVVVYSVDDGGATELGRHEPVLIGPLGQRFGAAIAPAMFDASMPMQDLVVGAPGYGAAEEGGVYFLRNEQDGPLHYSIVGFEPGPAGGSRMGASLATGDFMRDGLDDVIVGAPGVDTVSGFVALFAGNPGGVPLLEATVSASELGADDDEPGARFGSALALVPAVSDPTDRRAQLFVGAPRKTVEYPGGPVRTGAVYRVSLNSDASYHFEERFDASSKVEWTPGCNEDWGCADSYLHLHIREYGGALAADESVVLIGAPGSSTINAWSDYGDYMAFPDAGLFEVYVRQRDPEAEDGYFYKSQFAEDRGPFPAHGAIP